MKVKGTLLCSQFYTLLKLVLIYYTSQLIFTHFIFYTEPSTEDTKQKNIFHHIQHMSKCGDIMCQHVWTQSSSSDT